MNSPFVAQVEYLGSGVESGTIDRGEAALALYDYAQLFGYDLTLHHIFDLIRYWRTARSLINEAEKNWRPTPGKRTEVWDCVTAPFVFATWDEIAGNNNDGQSVDT